ncbi:MAG: tyrosine-type recombinase/integrase [Chloroflexi bacterium]|jgi:integrase|nr:tyrosine-type recombinase/integrase [Anaerolineaceae bacterium]NLI43881.1 tyrosine-type recombinase/integrase [Chloroflexota bacterium]HOE35745.1 tyrosine-type recombinase/integrase [Anaerolineaceae bacterium]HOT24980.1 tyrosine-type recombinase/integrase [Anaerolineaceae bacterium]HQH57574.1 tyrosine-type recombinase/integrase [Anaerolineaceae bacterium]
MERSETISQAISRYLASVRLSRSANTARTYANAMSVFSQVQCGHKLDVDSLPISELTEEPVIWVIRALKDMSPSTEQCYLTAVVGFYEFLAGENLAPINLPRVRLLIKQRARKPGIRLPQFPKSAIEKVLEYVSDLSAADNKDANAQLINLRDKAFLLTLADTGLRVHEACNLRRGDIDWDEYRAVIIGKGNREAVLRFSRRSLQAIKEYLRLRAELDGASGKALASLPVFARHDKGSGKKVKPISTTTGRAIVQQRVREAVGPEAVGSITPHSFRHYFVTTVLLASGNLKLAQELARHQNIAVTQRYSHLSDAELDKKYLEIFG